MNVQISFPLGTPQIQAAERMANQFNHAPATAQHLVAHDLDRERTQLSETVRETGETENPTVDEEGHLGAEHNGEKRESESDSVPSEAEDPLLPSDEDEIQGRFINVVV